MRHLLFLRVSLAFLIGLPFAAGCGGGSSFKTVPVKGKVTVGGEAVTSGVVTLIPRPAPLAPASFAALERVTAAAFGQRRKMLRGSLKALGIDPAAAGIDATRRAEELSVEQFCALARLLETGAPPRLPAAKRE